MIMIEGNRSLCFANMKKKKRSRKIWKEGLDSDQLSCAPAFFCCNFLCGALDLRHFSVDGFVPLERVKVSVGS